MKGNGAFENGNTQNNGVDMRIWYGFKRIPFSQEVKAEEMFLRPCMEEVSERVSFAAQQGLMFAVIGDVGAGKSTTL